MALEDLETLKPKVLRALVLKPSLQGLEQTVRMANWAEAHGPGPMGGACTSDRVSITLYHMIYMSAYIILIVNDVLKEQNCIANHSAKHLIYML